MHHGLAGAASGGLRFMRRLDRAIGRMEALDEFIGSMQAMEAILEVSNRSMEPMEIWVELGTRWTRLRGHGLLMSLVYLKIMTDRFLMILPIFLSWRCSIRLVRSRSTEARFCGSLSGSRTELEKLIIKLHDVCWYCRSRVPARLW